MLGLVLRVRLEGWSLPVVGEYAIVIVVAMM